MRVYACAAHAGRDGVSKVYALWMVADSKEHAIEKTVADAKRRYPPDDGWRNHVGTATVFAKSDIVHVLDRYELE